MAENIKNNSEILFIYDAKMTNPNGDMDNENKPRMDYDTQTNLVSDVRLKRYIRDYLEFFEDKPLFVNSNAKDAKDRAKQLKEKSLLQKDCIDVKLFGAVLADEGANTHFTGPVQFTWGYSLNQVELQESKTITSSFSSGEGIGKDFRVKYSLIVFSGSINYRNVGENKVDLNEEEIKLFDKALLRSIPLSKTRSKVGQTPRLYLRVEMKGDNFLKDLREYVSIKNKNINDISEVILDLSKLKEYLELNKSLIKEILYFKDSGLKIEGLSFEENNLFVPLKF